MYARIISTESLHNKQWTGTVNEVIKQVPDRNTALERETSRKFSSSCSKTDIYRTRAAVTQRYSTAM